MIDTGTDRPASIAALVAGDGRISLRDFTAAERLHRRVIANVWACETLADLDAYEDAETLLLDALDAAHPELAATVADAIETHRGCLTAATPSAQAVPHPAAPGSSSETQETTMFSIDTGADGSGSRGPWVSFKPKGSAKHGLPYKSWTLRSKTDTGSHVEKFGGMEKSVVLDIYAKGGQLCGSLKLGYSKSDGVPGVAPERRWFASPLKAEPRPSEERKATGGYAWTNALSVRCAIGGGLTATWEDDGWGVYKGFSSLVKLLNTGFAANEGLCPMVRCVGYIESGSGQNTTYEPQFEVMKWVPRPDCLKDDAPAIATAPAPEPPRQPAPQPAMTGALDDDIPF